MSLCVDVYLLDEDGQLQILEPAHPGADLAGFESWRSTVWGGQQVRTLGARLLPQLAAGDLTVAPGQVQDLLDECSVLLSNLDLIALPEGGFHERYTEQISARLANIEAAAARAQEIGGGIIIW